MSQVEGQGGEQVGLVLSLAACSHESHQDLPVMDTFTFDGLLHSQSPLVEKVLS